MMLSLGICTSTEGRDRSRDILDLGAPVSRFVLTAADDRRLLLPGWHRALERQVHGVVAMETFRAWQLDPHRDFAECARKVRSTWGAGLTYLEVGNEPDDGGSSSYTMTTDQFTAMLGAFCREFHQGQHEQPRLISGGLNSGQPPYALAVSFPPCVLLGLHAYDKSLNGWPWNGWGWGDLVGYLETYRDVWKHLRGVAITEWGHTSTDAEFGAEYVKRFVQVLRARPEVQLAEFFCLNDWQHRPHGLVQDDGARRKQFERYALEIRTQPPARDRRAFMFAGSAAGWR